VLKSRYISDNPITTSSNTEPDVRFDLLYFLPEDCIRGVIRQRSYPPKGIFAPSAAPEPNMLTSTDERARRSDRSSFGEISSALVRRFLDTDALIALYAHPNQALDHTLPNDESAALLDRFLATFERERQQGKIHFETMAQIERAARAKSTKSSFA
jgi:hypothetical protein